MNKTTAVIVAVVLTFVLCAFLFPNKGKETGEVGRYSWGRDGAAVLDTVDGTMYLLTGVDEKKVSILEIHLSSGLVWRKENQVHAQYFHADKMKFGDE